jgi:hypothetical protein
MKKLIALIALVVLTTSLVFAAATTVPNNATVVVACQNMQFSCLGPTGPINVTSEGSASTPYTTTWKIKYWGGSGTFNFTTPSGGFINVTPPSGGANTDLTIAPSGGTAGWTLSNIENRGGIVYGLMTPQCKSEGTMAYTFTVAAKDVAVKGTYTIIFAMDFEAL